ncbi:hypothetical protein [Arthrobacter sp. QXT-31]|uniref:hypothetical protein n=1 Tax=Arthrobacter sp. QXT-31 TaxID=1357915 RepID=UPI0009718C17|nr:hypothetical protein [Arthrobacter sp. QXT-31]APX00525.1 hypothetical protein BWQ92_01240 [Arthrobacter sp. QXT-31]
MNYREARKLARRAEHGFGLPDDATLLYIQNKLEMQRGRPIIVDELPGMRGSELCGVWLICADRDIVLHATVKSSWHRQQIILHEFSHMILQHDLLEPTEDLVTAFLPDLGVEVLRALGRRSYTDDAEFTAEALADQLAMRIINSEVPSLPEPLAFRRVFG